MKLTLLEDGVLDYKGDAATLATPNAVPSGSIGVRVKPSPEPKTPSSKEQFEDHIAECPQCANNKLCSVGIILTNDL